MAVELEKSAIILNHMFTGDYLNDNLGHEVINLFKADDKQNYIYLCRDGNYSKSAPPKYVIQVRRPLHSVHTLEIINIASNLELYQDSQEKVTYAHKPITALFASNKEQQEKCITFKAGLVIKPEKPLYICYQGKEPISNGITLKEKVTNDKGEEIFRFNVSQQLREYFTDGEDYDTLNDFCAEAFADFKNEEGWIQVAETISKDSCTEQKFPLLPADIYGIATWELAYSNAFKYFLETNNDFLKAFCELCLKKSANNDEKLSPLKENEKAVIKREWNHIDLLIEYGKYVFVIENKILSDFNGKDKDQLKVYKEVIDKEASYKDKTKILILLTPNHNNIKPNVDSWTQIYYSDVHDECKKLKERDEHFDTFVKMIELHTEKDYNYGAMKRRFERALSLLKTNKTNNNK